MKNPARVATLALAAVLSVATSSPSEPPPPDACDNPQAPVGATAIEIGAGSFDSPAFVAWKDGDRAEITYGPQGGTMTGVRVRIVGEALPGCLAISADIRDADGNQRASQNVPVMAYPTDDPGARLTDTMWLVYSSDPEPGTQVTIRARVGDLEVTRQLKLGPEPPVVDSLTPAEQTIEVGQSATFQLHRAPVGGPGSLYFQVTTAPPGVLDIGEEPGVVYLDYAEALKEFYALGKAPGTATIVLVHESDPTITFSATVTVVEPPAP